MPRRPHQRNPETVRSELVKLLINFEQELLSGDLRRKVIALIPGYHLLQDLGASLIPGDVASSARNRILQYFLQYPFRVISGEELQVVAGISEWARRVRELRVEHGWPIVSGEAAKAMAEDDEFNVSETAADAGHRVEMVNPSEMRPNHYILMGTNQDRDAAHRWNLARDIRNRKASVRDRLLEFLRANAGQPVTSEELRYVAKEKTEWARRVRELRTEHGWPVLTRNAGRPDLPVGVYVLEEDRQYPEHDRTIKDSVRREVLRRDDYRCTECRWSHDKWNRSDPRHLELHHIKHHSQGGDQGKENLITLCTVCHDRLHRKNNPGKA